MIMSLYDLQPILKCVLLLNFLNDFLDISWIPCFSETIIKHSDSFFTWLVVANKLKEINNPARSQSLFEHFFNRLWDKKSFETFGIENICSCPMTDQLQQIYNLFPKVYKRQHCPSSISWMQLKRQDFH